MEVIEKREIIHENEGKEYASKGVAGTGLGLGIAGTALGLLAMGGKSLFGLGASTSGVCDGPTPFQAWEKACNAELVDQKNLYEFALLSANARYTDRQQIDKEMFGLYKSQTDADFGLYKNQRDSFDVLQKQISDLTAHVAVVDAIRPYQDKLVQTEINNARKEADWNLCWRTRRMIEGEIVLPQTPTVTGYPSYSCCNNSMRPVTE